MGNWLMENKKWLGGGLLAVFFYVQANPRLVQAWPFVGDILGLFGAFLAGSGFLPSDKAVKVYGPDAK